MGSLLNCLKMIYFMNVSAANPFYLYWDCKLNKISIMRYSGLQVICGLSSLKVILFSWFWLCFKDFIIGVVIFVFFLCFLKMWKYERSIRKMGSDRRILMGLFQRKIVIMICIKFVSLIRAYLLYLNCISELFLPIERIYLPYFLTLLINKTIIVDF